MRNFMNASRQILFLMILLTGMSIWVQAQALQNISKFAGTGSIVGQVLIDGEPAPNATVVLLPGGRGQSRSLTPVMKTVSDKGGNFKFEKVPVGDYVLNVAMPGFVNPAEVDRQLIEQGTPVALDEGDEVRGIELSLKRGAVITGRVTDGSGQPIIEADVRLWRVDNPQNDTGLSIQQPFMPLTDDRGIYRLYGLSAGRYKVSVGQNEKWATVNGQGADIYLQTFHPDVTEQTKATIIELGLGEEANNVDIKLNNRLKAYAAHGRMIEAETGRPVARKQILSARANEQGRYQGQILHPNLFSTDTGTFRLDGLTSGRYMIFCVDGSDTYGEPTIFEIKDADIAGLELKVRPAASLSGRVVIEGTRDPQILALAQKLRLWVDVQPSLYNGQLPPQIAPDGSFKVIGLRPGKAHLSTESLKEMGLVLLRIEHNGEAVREFNLKEGEDLKGLRVVMAYSSAVIRGMIKTETGKLPADVRVTVQAYRIEKERTFVDSVEVDGLGRFVFQGLTPGEYEIIPYASNRVPLPTKKVTVTNDTETLVNFVVDFSVKNRDDKEK
jgi:hypothetical protein